MLINKEWKNESVKLHCGDESNLDCIIEAKKIWFLFMLLEMGMCILKHGVVYFVLQSTYELFSAC